MALNSEKEILQLQKRLKDLADQSYKQNVFTFSGFLGLAELDVYYRMEKELRYSGPEVFGGDPDTERKIIRFGSAADFGYEEEYPISCIHVKPLITKFADDFSHRDFLGALMNLGIERSCIGDIRVGNRQGYLYCLSSMGEFICDNLSQIKHTHVTCEIVEGMGKIQEEEISPVEVLVSSLRIDGCLAKLYKISRTESILLFQSGRVYVDGRLVENNSRMMKTGESINVRGYGKFIFQGIKYESKKGKLCLSILRYP